MSTAEATLASPCNRVCVMHPARQICIGCGRTLDEIARWTDLGEAERACIMAQLPTRLAASGAANAAQAQG
jgi:predicted Fe-S protein YdhL (DUF1289 family)